MRIKLQESIDYRKLSQNLYLLNFHFVKSTKLFNPLSFYEGTLSFNLKLNIKSLTKTFYMMNELMVNNSINCHYVHRVDTTRSKIIPVVKYCRSSFCYFGKLYLAFYLCTYPKIAVVINFVCSFSK